MSKQILNDELSLIKHVVRVANPHGHTCSGLRRVDVEHKKEPQCLAPAGHWGSLVTDKVFAPRIQT